MSMCALLKVQYYRKMRATHALRGAASFHNATARQIQISQSAALHIFPETLSYAAWTGQSYVPIPMHRTSARCYLSGYCVTAAV